MYETNNTTEGKMILPTELCEACTNEKGIFETAGNTLECLQDVLDVLDLFLHELDSIPEKRESKRPTPACFKENMTMIEEYAFAIKGDVNKLIKKFR
jgi:hypothetical protein